ncbi:hypothetical protein KP509_33G060200 [Ceratopteris richardii]|uniref:Pentatricopeptide repeat-containing protein n=1 Tax=Ceratopteris richardii TaxID=49495 RepID=A0A8T2QRZ6_CERRI|nr:hypothetical protein KP509_33G060200 [Ceratopteris richardii]
MVPMFVDCGSMQDAQKVFNKLSKPNEHSWTSLIEGYVHSGEYQNALDTFSKMQQDHVAASGYTYSALLRACGHLKCIKEGYKLHLDIVKHGYEEIPFVSEHVVTMYAECCYFTEARGIFHQLVDQSERLWTSLIVHYVECGLDEEALCCFTQMQQQNVTPSNISFVSSLKACSKLKNVDKGLHIHMYIIQEGYDDDIFVGNTLVDFYLACSLLSEALEVFDGLLTRDVVSWTILISGCVEHGLGHKALGYFESMLLEGVIPNPVTYFSVLKACTATMAIDEGRSLHIAIIKEGLEQEYLVSGILVEFYCKVGLLVEAQSVFDALPTRNVVIWTTLMTGYAEHGFFREALNCWSQMRAEGIHVDGTTFVCISKASTGLESISEGQAIHSSIVKFGLEKDLFIGCTLIDLYSAFGFLEDAQASFEALSSPDALAWNSLIITYMDYMQFEQALNYLRQMQAEGVRPNTMSWNAIVLGFAEHVEEASKSFEFFSQMLDQGVLPDGLTFVSLLKACGTLAALGIGKHFHERVVRLNNSDSSESGEMIIATSVIDMYCKCGSMRDAQLVFDKMPKRDLLAWTTLISGYARHGDCDHIFALLEMMRMIEMKLDEFIIFNVLTACSHAGQVLKGTEFYEDMSRVYDGISSGVIHDNCLIDMYSRAGKIAEAVMMVKEMPFKPDHKTWNTVLAACHFCVDFHVFHHTFENAAYSDDSDGSPFILMSNIYADYDTWED